MSGRTATWVWRCAVAVGVLVTVMCGLLLAGTCRDDRKIDADPAIARAEVVSTNSNRVVVRYAAAATPSLRTNSLLSPGGLFGLITTDVPQPGEGVMVEYSRSNPDLVRVADRGFGWSALRVALFLAAVWLVLAGLRLVLWFLARRRAAAATG
ncbi:MAG: 5'-nucleotidase [Segniliparus sp.]|uniref:5'-nucleotidase n=1 Tax=Segniliparus sp. TaxID=2804064 RepID=UPI003F376C73